MKLMYSSSNLLTHIYSYLMCVYDQIENYLEYSYLIMTKYEIHLYNYCCIELYTQLAKLLIYKLSYRCRQVASC